MRKRSRSKSNLNAKGRSEDAQKKDRFSRLPHEIQNSAAYRALRSNARSLLMELISLDRGNNNGNLYLSEADAADRLGLASRKTARSAFRELVEAGLIVCTSNAYYWVKTGTGRPRRWALTWLFDYINRRSPSHLWRQYHPKAAAVQRVSKGMAALKRYRRKPQEAPPDELNHEGQFNPFEVNSERVRSAGGRVRIAHSKTEPPETRHSVAYVQGVNFSHNIAVAMGCGDCMIGTSCKEHAPGRQEAKPDNVMSENH